MRLAYDPQADALRLILCDAEAESSREVARGVIISVDREGRAVAIEVLGARASMDREGLGRLSIDLQDL